MHRERFRSYFDFPFVAYIGIEVVERSKLFQILVPPVYLSVFLIHIFLRHLSEKGVAVVLCVAANDDFRALCANGGVGGILQMLVGDAAVVVLDFVIPFAFEIEGCL